MSVARVIEISSVSTKSFEDAIHQGIQRANRTLRNVEGAWIKDQNVMIQDGNITGYRVNMQVTFVLDDGATADPGI
ncbi:dodecin domain-containing protein [Candidatus Gracilibacteria bacterium]|nr:dodecin domain-containing protein [Candidatus Gracilibacteria bacterium]